MKSPYLDWITCHLNINEYRSNYSYSLNDLVTINDAVYKSLCNNNLNSYPVNSSNWTKII